MTGEYWVFKYVEDLVRQETRNIGVVLKTDAGVFARFLGEREGGAALDLRTVRGVVRHTPTYKQWVDYWRHCLRESPSADAARDQLLHSLRGNFISSERSTVALPDGAPSEAVAYLCGRALPPPSRPSPTAGPAQAAVEQLRSACVRFVEIP